MGKLTVTITVYRQGRSINHVPKFFSKLSFQCEPSDDERAIKNFICEEMQFKGGTLINRKDDNNPPLVRTVTTKQQKEKETNAFFVNADPVSLRESLKSEINDIESNLTTKFKDKYAPIKVIVKDNKI